MDSAGVLAPDLMSVRGYRAPQYPQSSSSVMEAAGTRSGEFVVKARRFPTVPARGRQAEDVPPWVKPTLARLVELMQLSPGWDSYEGLPPTRSNLAVALNVLAAVMSDNAELPWVVPLPSGGFQLEWHLDSADVEIAIDGEDSAICVDDREIPAGGGRWRKELPKVRALISGN